MEFWLANIDRLNVKKIFQTGEPVLLDKIDGVASSTGCGLILKGDKIAARVFSEEERRTRSTHRGLANILFSLEAFLEQIRGRAV